MRQHPGLQTQVREDLLDHWLLYDRRNDLQLAAAFRAVRHVGAAAGQYVASLPQCPGAPWLPVSERTHDRGIAAPQLVARRLTSERLGQRAV